MSPDSQDSPDSHMKSFLIGTFSDPSVERHNSLSNNNNINNNNNNNINNNNKNINNNNNNNN